MITKKTNDEIALLRKGELRILGAAQDSSWSFTNTWSKRADEWTAPVRRGEYSI